MSDVKNMTNATKKPSAMPLDVDGKPVASPQDEHAASPSKAANQDKNALIQQAKGQLSAISKSLNEITATADGKMSPEQEKAYHDGLQQMRKLATSANEAGISTGEFVKATQAELSEIYDSSKQKFASFSKEAQTQISALWQSLSGAGEPQQTQPGEDKPKKNFFEGLWDSVTGMFNNINAGGLLGGLLGLGGAWMIGSAFGGGMVGTIASVLLAIPLFLLGRKMGDNTLNGLMGRPSDAQRVEAGRGQSPHVAQAVAQQVTPTPSPAMPVPTVPNLSTDADYVQTSVGSYNKKYNVLLGNDRHYYAVLKQNDQAILREIGSSQTGVTCDGEKLWEQVNAASGLTPPPLPSIIHNAQACAVPARGER